jgi:hypothetical protein
MMYSHVQYQPQAWGPNYITKKQTDDNNYTAHTVTTVTKA